jgi:Fe-S-cluster containining protein
MGSDGLARADRRLLAVLDERLGAGRRRAGPWLVCRPGCAECCHGLFPITALDAWRLRSGLAELAAREPARAAAIVARARAQRATLQPGFPGDWARGTVRDEPPAGDAWFTRHARLPCPVLDPATGVCELYAHRPVTCRTFGPPVKVDGELLPPCHLCFEGVDEASIAACRVEPDPQGLEDRILARLGGEETLIALALP